MEEPQRIGLTKATHSMLDELLEELNPKESEEGMKLIKFDLYRLAVALGVKKAITPPQLEDISQTSFRVTELDRDGAPLYTVLETSGIVPNGIPIYSYIERLAEEGIKEFYQAYIQTGELPWEEYFN